MKKSMWKRLGTLLLQHLLAAGILVAVAGLLLNSYIAVDTIDGVQIYRIFPMDRKQEFEESEIYHALFRNAVSDITQLVAIRGQLETDGVLDPVKKIDVTEYARQTGTDRGCRLTVVYELDDIVKWGKYGVEYSNRIMSMSEFVNYFGSCFYPENFELDEYGQLAFKGFNRVEHPEGEETDPQEGEKIPEDSPLALTAAKMEEYTETQLEDLVFSYIITRNVANFDMSREDDGRLIVSIPMLSCRYATVDGKKQLTSYADNWVDYMLLQENVATAVENLTRDYQRYQVCSEAYREGNSNVKYMVRMMTDQGIRTYTNVAQLKDLEDNEVTEFFGEFRRYLIYYPDSLVYMGNTILDEAEIDSYISLYGYAYPDTTHIWIGIDAGYSVEEDAFYSANALYQRIVPNVDRILGLIVVLTLVWLGLVLCLTVSLEMDEMFLLNRFDRIWTEAAALLGAALVYGGVQGYRFIMDIAGTAGVMPTQLLGIQMTALWRYGAFALYGFYLSAAFSLIWYSLVRRFKGENLWKGSFLYFFCQTVGRAVRFVLRHRNSAVSTLLPYNFFLFFNLGGIVFVYELWEKQFYVLMFLGCLVVVDGIVGVFLFRRSAEQIEIMEGINRIRKGEEEFKIDTESLHGASREMADAVNNIGEGIREAVKTSMKDEKLKSDLITNVSHDLKTPLTSIINYVDLLKRQEIRQEPARGYIAILDSKAQRLKQLTDDLVEVSKISSGSLILELEKLNLTELMNQGLGEFSQKLEECRLQVVFEGGELPAYIYADSRRMWRVVENLFNNICKYAMEGTRVYVDISGQQGKVVVSVKNISRQQMNVRPEELTERFIRGDSSRTTEGSGLGLSIAKSLVQVQGGSFEIFLDGDLFKVVLSFPEYEERAEDPPAG